MAKVLKWTGALLMIVPALGTAAVWIWAIFLQSNPDAAALVFVVTMYSIFVFVPGLVLLGIGYLMSLA